MSTRLTALAIVLFVIALAYSFFWEPTGKSAAQANVETKIVHSETDMLFSQIEDLVKAAHYDEALAELRKLQLNFSMNQAQSTRWNTLLDLIAEHRRVQGQQVLSQIEQRKTDYFFLDVVPPFGGEYAYPAPKDPMQLEQERVYKAYMSQLRLRLHSQKEQSAK